MTQNKENKCCKKCLCKCSVTAARGGIHCQNSSCPCHTQSSNTIEGKECCDGIDEIVKEFKAWYPCTHHAAQYCNCEEALKFFRTTLTSYGEAQRKMEWFKGCDFGYEKGYRQGVEAAVKLSDEIELQGETTMEEWKAFKRFRNTLRDRLKALLDKEV